MLETLQRRTVTPPGNRYEDGCGLEYRAQLISRSHKDRKKKEGERKPKGEDRRGKARQKIGEKSVYVDGEKCKRVGIFSGARVPSKTARGRSLQAVFSVGLIIPPPSSLQLPPPSRSAV